MARDMQFHISAGGQRLATVTVPKPAVDSPDPVLVSVDREDGKAVVGLDFQDTEHVNIGYWPNGEEWELIACVHPTEVTA